MAIALAHQAWAGELPSRARAHDERIDRWRSLVDQAEQARGEGRLDEAETLYQRVLEEAGEPERPSLLLARAVDGLADLCRAEQRLDEAETLYLRAATMWEPLLGADQPRLATTLHNLGLVYLELGKLDEAEPALRRALAIWEATLGAESEQARLSRRAVREAGARQEEDHPPERISTGNR
jgi:tetratricopeptide (TPR) repeat protein